MTGTNCDLFTHKSSRSYLNHLVPLHFLGGKSQYEKDSYNVVEHREFLESLFQNGRSFLMDVIENPDMRVL
jgi:hypothetical protein